MKRVKDMKKTRFTTTLLIGALLTAGMSVAQDREERISRSFDIGPNGEFSLRNISGDISVSGTSGNQVTIEAVKRLHGRGDRDLLDSVEIDISHHGDRVRVETRYPRNTRRGGDDHQHGHGGVSVDYRITVPVGTEVEIGSISGDVTLEGVEGETSVSSVSGEIEVSDVANLVQAKSVSGDVDVRNARSDDDVEIASVSGDVTIDSIEAEELSISSVSGEVRIRQVSCEQGEFESVSGDIRYTGRIVRGGRYEFTTHSGDVVITIGEDVGFELEASTFSGEIESEFPMTVTSSSKRRRSISAVVGNGSAVIEATTFSGDVEIRSR